MFITCHRWIPTLQDSDQLLPRGHGHLSLAFAMRASHNVISHRLSPSERATLPLIVSEVLITPEWCALALGPQQTVACLPLTKAKDPPMQTKSRPSLAVDPGESDRHSLKRRCVPPMRCVVRGEVLFIALSRRQDPPWKAHSRMIDLGRGIPTCIAGATKSTSCSLSIIPHNRGHDIAFTRQFSLLDASGWQVPGRALLWLHFPSVGMRT